MLEDKGSKQRCSVHVIQKGDNWANFMWPSGAIKNQLEKHEEPSDIEEINNDNKIPSDQFVRVYTNRLIGGSEYKTFHFKNITKPEHIIQPLLKTTKLKNLD